MTIVLPKPRAADPKLRAGEDNLFSLLNIIGTRYGGCSRWIIIGKIHSAAP
jgi:hypothetical protein